MLFRLILLVAFLSANGSEDWPWKSSCHERHTPGYCDVTRREDLPEFRVDAKYDVFVVYHPVQGDASAEIQLLDSLLGVRHSALAFEEVGGDGQFHVEFYALQFGPSIIAPAAQDGKLQWNDTAVIGWQPSLKKSEWPTQLKLGQVNGQVLNHFMEWIPAHLKHHPLYELWSVWSSVDLKQGIQRYFDDSTCHRFTEDALIELHRLGATLRSKDVLCRNYFTYVSDAPLLPVHDAPERANMMKYYGKLRNLFVDKHYYSKWQMMGDIFKYISEVQNESVAYVKNGTEYFYAHLTSPFVGLRPQQGNQRMILPWQPLVDAKAGECTHWGFGLQNTSDGGQEFIV